MPRSHVQIAVQRLLKCCSLPELTENTDPGAIAIMQRRALSTMQNLPDEGEPVPPEVAKEVCTLSALAVALAAEVGLCSAPVAELVSLALACAAALFVTPEGSGQPNGLNEQDLSIIATALEPLGEVMECFTFEIFQTLQRQEELLRPRWSEQDETKQKNMVFAAVQAEGQGMLADFYQSEVRLYKALQGVCLWSLTLAVRAAGQGPNCFTSTWLWEFASKDPFCAAVLVKGALTFRHAECKETLISVPQDLANLQDIILGAALGLVSPHVIFGETSGDIDIQSQNETVMCHCAALASVMSDCKFLDSLLACPWGSEETRLSAFANFFAGLLTPASSPALEQHTHELKKQIQQHGNDIWNILSPMAMPTRGFLKSCAVLAYAAPPPPTTTEVFFKAATLTDTILADSMAVASLVVLAANADVSPDKDSSKGIKEALEVLPVEAKLAIVARVQSWQGPVRSEYLGPWMALLHTPAQDIPEVPRPMVSSKQGSGPSEVPSKAQELLSRSGVLQKLAGVPPEFRCAIDKGLLVDPVKSPAGHVFERSALVRELTKSGGKCPISGTPLTLADCERDTGLRMRALKWVRENCARTAGN